MTRFILATIISWPALACAASDVCKPPNVARVVAGANAEMTYSLDLTARHPSCKIACPAMGKCEYVCAIEPPPDHVVCLTPEQNAEAEGRWR